MNINTGHCLYVTHGKILLLLACYKIYRQQSFYCLRQRPNSRLDIVPACMINGNVPLSLSSFIFSDNHTYVRNYGNVLVHPLHI